MKRHIFYILVIVAMLLYFFFGSNGILQYNELLKIRDTYVSKISQLEGEISLMEKRIELLKKDKEYLEEVLKKELNLQNPGEDLYIIPNDKKISGIGDNKSD